MNTLQELVQQRRSELVVEQTKLFEDNKALFISILVNLLGRDLVESMNIQLTFKFKRLDEVSVENINGSFVYNNNRFIIELEKNYFNICLWKTSNSITIKLDGSCNLKDSLINYLSNIGAFHNTNLD